MQRSILLAFSFALTIFAICDYAIHLFIHTLSESGDAVVLALLGQLTTPFLPVALAGMTAGYLGTPWGFRIAFLACIAGQLIVFTLRYDSFGFEALSSAMNVASMAGWTIGSALMCGVCGWAGERLHAKL